MRDIVEDLDRAVRQDRPKWTPTPQPGQLSVCKHVRSLRVSAIIGVNFKEGEIRTLSQHAIENYVFLPVRIYYVAQHKLIWNPKKNAHH